MTADITLVHPDDIRFISSKSVEYLKSAHDEFFGLFDALEKAKNQEGFIFEVRSKGELLGCFYLRFIQNHLGKVMNLELLGGQKILSWRDDFVRFINLIAKDEHIDEFTYLGRKGFAKFFDGLKYVASIYRHKLTA